MKKFYHHLVSFILFLMISSETFSQAPVANFTAIDSNGCAPFLVNFIDMSTNNSTSWTWDFGDGFGISALQSPSYFYSLPGTYTVKLTVSNASGIDSIVKVGFITVYNNPSIVTGNGIDTVCPGDTVTFYNASIPGEAPISSYSWNFNDGSPFETTNPAYHTFINMALQIVSFTPTLFIEDTNGCSSIANMPPVYVLPLSDCTTGFAEDSETNHSYSINSLSSHGIFNVRAHFSLEGLMVMNSSGQKVLQMKTGTTFDISGSPPGIYLVVISFKDGESVVAKVAKQ